MFKPTNNRIVWDFWITQHNNKYHMHYLTDERREDSSLRHWNAKLGYAVSDDLINWQDHGIILTPSEDPEDWDSKAIWTGSTILLNEPIDGYNMALLFTSHSKSADRLIQKTGLALSNDFINWKKYENNPIIEANDNFYTLGQSLDNFSTAWRDPKVVYDEKSDEYLAFITAERKDVNDWQAGTIALCTSKDLKSWHIKSPIVEKYRTPQMEVPRILKHKDKYLLMVSSSMGALENTNGNGQQAVFIFISDNLQSEFVYSQTLYHTQTPDDFMQEPFYYTPEFTKDLNGNNVILGWYGVNEDNYFVGQVSDPIKFEIDDNYKIILDQTNHIVKLLTKHQVKEI